MFGVYFHIPFCKSKCGYCDFYSVASQALVQPMVETMLHEVELRSNYFDSAVIAGLTCKPLKEDGLLIGRPRVEHGMTGAAATLYFGGGTPSLLRPEQISALAEKAIQVFNIKNVAEFTVEINPDDATPDYLQGLRSVGVDRLSIGIQSFFDDDLQRVNRRHTSQQAKQGVLEAQRAGFKNISIDLIYGLPQMTLERWRSNLETAFSLNVQHLSAYALSVEEHTPFGIQQRKGKLVLPAENEVAEQSRLLDELSALHGFTHYEISNFAQGEFFSRHNTAYWQQKSYIGVGPSAHSYNGEQRQHNVANNTQYVQRVNAACSVIARRNDEAISDFFEIENLTEEQRYNEYIFTGLRTMWGVDLSYIQQVFHNRLYKHCLENAKKHFDNQNFELINGRLTIPQNRWLVADSIIVDLIWA